MFCQAVTRGLSQSDAYKLAYKTGNQRPATTSNNAYMLRKNSDVTARMTELREDLAERGLWSREDSINAMIDVIREPDNQTCKISAVRVINEMYGFNAPIETKLRGTVIIATVHDENL